MRIVFLVQGEGKGHLTQAISLGQILTEAGHEVVGALVGQSEGRTVPAFFKKEIGAPVFLHDAPNIIYNSDGGGLNLSRTLRTHLAALPRYLSSLRKIHQTIQSLEPDLLINFYEIYGGLYNLRYGTKIPMVCIAHQYLLQHPLFTFPPNSKVDRWLINFNTEATSWLCKKKLSLSFRSFPQANVGKNMVVPPLLRKAVRELKPKDEDFFLVYMTHHSLSKQIISWHARHTEVKLQCFWDNAAAPELVQHNPNLIFRQIDATKYLQLLATCKGLVTTAGFESVCEAMYLGKPVMMVPVPQHFEQECNALDGVNSGAGVAATTFDLSLFMAYLPKHKDQSAQFRNWYMKGDNIFINAIEAYGNGTVSKIMPSQTIQAIGTLSPA
ncbi:glycosyltransferase family protein [Dyadobacter tibetensis]|uniref:glycosyltransferase family protein n=1 Tax=Dyadobacter tibetensis TaxID=1211851 RepID=UPI0004705694|nr:glycosyltransferase family protein [Dyadobacter tibetensis]